MRFSLIAVFLLACGAQQATAPNPASATASSRAVSTNTSSCETLCDRLAECAQWAPERTSCIRKCEVSSSSPLPAYDNRSECLNVQAAAVDLGLVDLHAQQEQATKPTSSSGATADVLVNADDPWRDIPRPQSTVTGNEQPARPQNASPPSDAALRAIPKQRMEWSPPAKQDTWQPSPGFRIPKSEGTNRAEASGPRRLSGADLRKFRQELGALKKRCDQGDDDACAEHALQRQNDPAVLAQRDGALLVNAIVSSMAACLSSDGRRYVFEQRCVASAQLTSCPDVREYVSTWGAKALADLRSSSVVRTARAPMNKIIVETLNSCRS